MATVKGNTEIKTKLDVGEPRFEILKTLASMVNATDTALFTITIPNNIAGALISVTIGDTLADGDSTNSKTYILSVSRIAGAVAKCVASTAAQSATTSGATADATTIITVPAVVGGAAEKNTFTVTARVTRSAGSSDGHAASAIIQCINTVAQGGITVS